MQFIVIITFAPGHNPEAGINVVVQHLNGNGQPYRVVGPTAFVVTGPTGTAASLIGNAIGTTCLQDGDEIFVAEITANAFEA